MHYCKGEGNEGQRFTCKQVKGKLILKEEKSGASIVVRHCPFCGVGAHDPAAVAELIHHLKWYRLTF